MKPQAIDIDERTAFQRLSLLGRASLPIFYEGGIIAARLGFYHLARMMDGTRLLTYAVDLQDMEKKEYPGGSVFFKYPGRLFGVGAYGEDESTGTIYADMVKHQEDFRKAIHTEGTLVRTGRGVYQSRHVSFLELPDQKQPDKVNVYAFVAGLPTGHFVPVQRDIANGKHFLGDTSFALTPNGPVSRAESLPLIMHHYTELQKGLARGASAILTQAERSLSRPARTFLKLKLGTLGVIDRLERNTIGQFSESMEEMQHGNAGPMYDFVTKSVSYLSLRNLTKGGLTRLAWPLIEASLNIRNDTKLNRRKLPNGLGRYALPQPVETPLNKFLNPLRDTTTINLQPMDAREAQIVPSNVNVAETNPFDAQRFEHIGFNTTRAPFGSMLFIYRSTSLILQPNGLWIAAVYDKDDTKFIRGNTIVGYSARLDNGTKPEPAPAVAAYLKEGHVIRFTHNAEPGRQYNSELVPLADVRDALAEIHRAGDGDLLVAEKPPFTPLNERTHRTPAHIGLRHLEEVRKRFWPEPEVN